MKYQLKVFLSAILLIPMTVMAAQNNFQEQYKNAAKDMIPFMQITTCKTILSKKPTDKKIVECRLNSTNSLLSIDFINKKFTGAWLMLDSAQLDHASDLMRAGGMFLRAGRGSSYGDYLAISSNVFYSSKQNAWKESCVDDKESDASFCVSSDDGRIFNLTLTPLKH